MKKIIKLLVFLFVINMPYKELMAQEKDSVVVLPHRVALWYLEEHELAKTLQVKLSLRDSTIIVYVKRIDKKDSVIIEERLNTKRYRKIIKSMEKSKDTWKKDSQAKDKTIKKVKNQRNGLGILAIILLILALI